METSEHKTYSLYIHINKANGKAYVGITSRDPEKRWGNGNGYSYNEHFYRAIKKYGWDGFIHRVIFTGLSEEKACVYEKCLIKEFNLTDPNFGYNNHEGGGLPPVLAGEKNPFWQNHSQSGENHPMYGKKHSEETRRKMSEKHWNVKGANNPNAKKVLCKETQVVYPSAIDAQNGTGVSRNNITAACRGKQKTAGGFHWQFIA